MTREERKVAIENMFKQLGITVRPVDPSKAAGVNWKMRTDDIRPHGEQDRKDSIFKY